MFIKVYHAFNIKSAHFIKSLNHSLFFINFQLLFFPQMEVINIFDYGRLYQ